MFNMSAKLLNKIL